MAPRVRLGLRPECGWDWALSAAGAGAPAECRQAPWLTDLARTMNLAKREGRESAASTDSDMDVNLVRSQLAVRAAGSEPYSPIAADGSPIAADGSPIAADGSPIAANGISNRARWVADGSDTFGAHRPLPLAVRAVCRARARHPRRPRTRWR